MGPVPSKGEMVTMAGPRQQTNPRSLVPDSIKLAFNYHDQQDILCNHQVPSFEEDQIP
jgi:hypothetical protein